jgi:23S rRNA (adenine-N6)-dimethyltransferase
VAAHRGRSSRDARRRALGQNLLASQALAERLVAAAGVVRGDLVVEIGAGRGVLTAALARRARRVLAIELDPDWAAGLRERFARSPHVQVVEGDALTAALPREPFRVVANLPFARTTALLHRLLDDPSLPLQRADLVLQWEVARKRAGEPRSVVSAAWSPWWSARLGGRLPRTAFRPVPAVDAGVLVVERRPEPLLPPVTADAYAAFVRALFTGELGPQLDAAQWAALYAAYAQTNRP